MSNIMNGYQFKVPVRGSWYNRVGFNKRMIVIAVAVVLFIAAMLVAYFIIPNYIISYQEMHRFDNVAGEKAAITQVVVSELSDIPYDLENLPAEIELLEVYNDRISIWTKNLCYYGPMKGFTPYDIEFRDSVFDE